MGLDLGRDSLGGYSEVQEDLNREQGGFGWGLDAPGPWYLVSLSGCTVIFPAM